MGQIIAIDYGKARCGIAATDDMQIIASGLDTVQTQSLVEFLKKYFTENKVDDVVIGLPVDLRGNISEVETDILKFIEIFKKSFRLFRFIVLMKDLHQDGFVFISQSGKSKNKDKKKD